MRRYAPMALYALAVLTALVSIARRSAADAVAVRPMCQIFYVRPGETAVQEGGIVPCADGPAFLKLNRSKVPGLRIWYVERRDLGR